VTDSEGNRRKLSGRPIKHTTVRANEKEKEMATTQITTKNETTTPLNRYAVVVVPINISDIENDRDAERHPYLHQQMSFIVVSRKKELAEEAAIRAASEYECCKPENLKILTRFIVDSSYVLCSDGIMVQLMDAR